MESGHPVEGHFGRAFPRSVIVSELWRPEVARVGKKCPLLAFFGKTTPYWKIFKILFRSDFIATPIHVMCANVVKFGRSEIGKVVRYLPDKKNKISLRSPAHASAQIAPKICRGQRQTMCKSW